MPGAQENKAGATYSTADTGDKPADPYKDLNLDRDTSIKEKVEDLIAFVEGVKFGMMTTRQSQSGLLVSRCMSLAARENGIDFLFHTNTETGKTDELHSDPHVNLGFLKNSTGEWASVSGTATVDNGSGNSRRYYTPALKAWIGDLGDKIHDGGPEDPRLAVIKVQAKTATYALQKGTALSRGLEISRGAITGNTANTNELRELTEEELQTFRNSQQLIS
ncbi:hypothetical protein C7212DRAFT_353268 [Tuber magnatum]|uniref:General stress protein FMN-binding split barrel domain-containing protein n=1 Tax=Tuber magnatum TaxID=42249 RepID=A0A317SLN5_9PEZI|nr:hypothetical protein C7212DRAFT_353268 [Tuber magnatum]